MSEFTLPAKDKANEVKVCSKENDVATLSFAKDLKIFGNVELTGLELVNDKEFSISMDKDSKGNSELVLRNIKTGKLKNITGKKGISKVAIYDCANLSLTGGITDVNALTLTCGLTTTTKAAVNMLNMSENGTWDAYGVTTIGTVNLSALSGNNHLGTCYSIKNGKSTGIPQLTITGTVTGGKLPVKIFEFDTGKEIPQEIENYSDAKLVLAKAESADKFIADDYAYFNESNVKYEFSSDSIRKGIVSYKDKSGYVTNGTTSDKAVVLSQKEDEDNDWTDSYSYVKNYAEAIEIINSIGNKNVEYKITLQQEETLTVLKNDGSADLGALTLPKAGKAKSVTIAGKVKDGGNNPIQKLIFTGTISPNCNLNFENVILNEVTSDKKPVDGITLKAGNYHVEFAKDVKTVNTDNKDLFFKAIDGSKGEVTFAGGLVGVIGEMKLKKLQISGSVKIAGTNGNITITEIEYLQDNITLDLNSMKGITLTNVSNQEDSNFDSNVLNVTTYYKNKTLEKSETQLSVNGEVESSIEVNICPNIYNGNEYKTITQDDLEKLVITKDVTPKTYQKIVKAPKMTASENVNLMVGKVEGGWTDSGLHAVKQSEGLYFTQEESGIEVVGYNENEKEVYRAEFFTWEQAVKEIDKLDHKDWTYTITLLEDYLPSAPIKTLTLPAKAKKVIIDGRGEKGLATLATKVSIKTETEFKDITVGAMKKTGNNYYGIPLTLDVGKNKLTLTGLKQGCDMRELGYLNSQIKLSGSANSGIIITPENIPQERAHENGYCGIYTQISKVGNVTLNKAVVIRNGQLAEAKECYYDIKDGIQGVKELILTEGVNVGAGKSEVSVTDLVIGEPLEKIGENISVEEHENEEGEVVNVDTYLRRNDFSSRIEAKNITVSGITTMASAALKAGTTTVGDGKITLNNVIFRDTNNNLEGKQDNKGNSQITIKGTATYDAESAEGLSFEHRSAACISLYLSNSTRTYVKLAEGMVLLTAPKAPASMFNPNYDWIEGDEVREPHMGPYTDYMELYNSGNSIKPELFMIIQLTATKAA